MTQRCCLAGGQGPPACRRAKGLFRYRKNHPRTVPTQRAPKRKTVTQWTCCVCGHSGMSVNIPVCPYCQTPRCAYCVVERVRVKPAHLSDPEMVALTFQNNHRGGDRHRYDIEINIFHHNTQPCTQSAKDTTSTTSTTSLSWNFFVAATLAIFRRFLDSKSF